MKKIFRKNKKTNLLKHSYRPCDYTQNRSDSEHTQSSQIRNNGRFRMTKNCHPKAFSGRHPEGETRRTYSESIENKEILRSYSFPQNDGESNKTTFLSKLQGNPPKLYRC